MQVQAPIVLIKNMEKDSFIGYGRQYKTKTNEKLLIINKDAIVKIGTKNKILTFNDVRKRSDAYLKVDKKRREELKRKEGN